jgi:hypothetical protein
MVSRQLGNSHTTYKSIHSASEISSAEVGRRLRGPTMQTSKEYRHNAQVCLKLASETTQIYAKMALIDLAREFRALAEDLERLRRVARR